MITKRHSTRNITTFELYKLEEELGKAHGLYVRVEVRWQADRLQLVGRAYSPKGGFDGPIVHQAMSTLSRSDARPLQTPIYWLMYDLWCQAENERAAREPSGEQGVYEALPRIG